MKALRITKTLDEKNNRVIEQTIWEDFSSTSKIIKIEKEIPNEVKNSK